MSITQKQEYAKNLSMKFVLIEAETVQLLRDIVDMKKFISDEENMKYGLYHCKERGTLKNRIHMLRNDLLELKKQLYKI